MNKLNDSELDKNMMAAFPGVEKMGVTRFFLWDENKKCGRWWWAMSYGFFNVKKFRLDKPKSPADTMQFNIYHN